MQNQGKNQFICVIFLINGVIVVIPHHSEAKMSLKKLDLCGFCKMQSTYPQA